MSASNDHSNHSKHTNRLAGESSPYLLLHQHNPVDWYPWGEEALARAREEDKPIFLSVGYSTCYWCHVMERESFSNPEVARVMNERFVNVKVDREERPDIDETYMAATQILAGQGGWPNSVFLTPELKPFYAGTYFPPDDAHGRPGFPQVLAGLAGAWKDRREDVHVQADEVAEAMRRILEERFAPGERVPAPGAAERACEGLRHTFDRDHGGFGRSPKFPTPSNLYLLHALAVRADGRTEGDPSAAAMLALTLDRMARGGIYDQLGGGFHRYSTDGEWLVPHFEKMLYDNGALLELYALEHERTGSPEAARIVRETAAFLEREMTLPDGAFASAIDAETDGREGAFYVWTASELHEALGDEDFAFLAPLYGFDRGPFFRDPHAPEAEPAYVLHLPEPLAEQAVRRRTRPEDLLEETAPLRRRLFEARSRRPRPLTDDKILADWNGLAIRGLATAGRVLGDDGMIALARRAADRVLEMMRPAGGPLLHAVRGGTGRIPAYLSDYAFLVRGLLGLHEATSERQYLDAAIELAEEQEERLAAPHGGYYNAAAADDLLFRSQEIFDGATPAANAVAVLNALEMAERAERGAGSADGSEEAGARWRDRAERALAAFSPVIERSPEAVRMLSLATLRFHEVVGTDAAPAATASKPSGESGSEEERQARAVVEHALTLGEVDDDGGRSFRLELTIADGWHLTAPAAGASSDRSAVALTADGAALLDVRYPPGSPWEGAPGGNRIGGEMGVYTGTVTIEGRLRGGGHLVLTYQPCDDSRCLAPVERKLALGP